MRKARKQALHIEVSRKMQTSNNIGLVKKMNFIVFWFCKWLLFHELYFKQLIKTRVLLFGKSAKIKHYYAT